MFALFLLLAALAVALGYLAYAPWLSHFGEPKR